MTESTVTTLRILGRDVAAVRGIAVSVCVVAALVLLGWAAGIDLLTRAGPTLPRMMPSTAVLIVLTAVALERCAFVPRSRLGVAVGWLVAIGSAAVLFAYVTGIDPWVGSLLTPVQSGEGVQIPGLPAPNTAAAILALAFAIIMMDRGPLRRGVHPAEVAAGTAATIATAALIGQTYGAAYLYGVGAYTAMSMPAAVCVLALSVGACAARPDRGLGAALRSHRLGVTVARRLVPLAIGVPIVFGWLVSTGHQAGYFDVPLGTALEAVAIMLVGLFAVGRTAVVIDRLDAERQRMTEERQTALAQAASEARFRSIFENTAVALVEHDASGLTARLAEFRGLEDAVAAAAITADQDLVEWMLAAAPVVDANPAALALFEAPSKEALRASWRDSILPEAIDVFVRGVGALAAGRETFEAELPIRSFGGIRRDLIVSIALPHPPALGRIVASFVDVTERKRAQQTVLDARRTREAAAHAATEAERRRMARELHDGALQELTAVKLMLEAEQKQHAGEAIEIALRQTSAIIQEVRAVVEDLSPPELTRGTLPEAISTQARVLTARSSVALICELQPTVHLPIWMAREVYRIAQEAIGNAVRHGRPRRVAVRLWQGRLETGLEVEDDGAGFDSQVRYSGSGLVNLRERAAGISADLSIESAPRCGARVRLIIPTDAWSESDLGSPPERGAPT